MKLNEEPKPFLKPAPRVCGRSPQAPNQPGDRSGADKKWTIVAPDQKWGRGGPSAMNTGDDDGKNNDGWGAWNENNNNAWQGGGR